jgi:hypothetical protein
LLSTRTVVVLLVLGRSLAWGAATGLNQIPTTDLVPENQILLQLQNGNFDVRGRDSMFHQPQLTPQSEIGLPWSLEGGIDVAPSDPPDDYRPVMNLKWRPIDEDHLIPAAALGVSQLGIGFTPSYYLTLSKTLNYDEIQYEKFRAHHRNVKLRGIRLHAGVVGTDNVWKAMVGTDIEVNDWVVLYADWLSGASSSVSLGGIVILTVHTNLQVALLRENDQDRLTGLLLAVTHTFDLDHPFEW